MTTGDDTDIPIEEGFTTYTSMAPTEDMLFLGIDVGTGSARAGIFDATGTLITMASCEIALYRVTGLPLCYQQSSQNIWKGVTLSNNPCIILGKGPKERLWLYQSQQHAPCVCCRKERYLVSYFSFVFIL